MNVDHKHFKLNSASNKAEEVYIELKYQEKSPIRRAT